MNNKNEYTLSVIIPVYNVEKYLSRCLDSVISQEKENCEVIIIDDGSTDGCPHICDYYANSFSYVKVIHQKNGGLSKARNVGMNNANGKYIMFLDSDDWIEDKSVKRIEMLIETYEPDIITGKAFVVDESGKKKDKMNYFIKDGLYTMDSFFQMQKKKSAFSACAPFYIFNKALLTKYNLKFKEGILQEDDLWTPVLLSKATTLYYDDNYFYNHFIRSTSIMHGSGADVLAKYYFIVCEELDTYFMLNPSVKRPVLENHISDIYLQAICMTNDPHEFFKKFPRSFPLKYAYYSRMKVKSVLYFISPKLYLWIHRIIKGT